MLSACCRIPPRRGCLCRRRRRPRLLLRCCCAGGGTVWWQKQRQGVAVAHFSLTNHFSVAAEHISPSGAAVIKRERESGGKRVAAGACNNKCVTDSQQPIGNCSSGFLFVRLWLEFRFNFCNKFKKLTNSAAEHFFQVQWGQFETANQKTVSSQHRKPPPTDAACKSWTLPAPAPPPQPSRKHRMVCLLLNNHMIE